MLVYFQRVLWPRAQGPAVTRDRLRILEPRIRDFAELEPELVEQLFRDAVDGARLHPWNSTVGRGYWVQSVFGRCDRIEELAELARRRRATREARATASPKAEFHARALPPARETSPSVARDVAENADAILRALAAQAADSITGRSSARELVDEHAA